MFQAFGGVSPAKDKYGASRTAHKLLSRTQEVQEAAGKVA